MVGKTNAILTIDRNNYGDGSLNTVSDGYKGHIAVNGITDIRSWTNDYARGNLFGLQSYTRPSNVFTNIGFWEFFRRELLTTAGLKGITGQSDDTENIRNLSPIKDKVITLNQFDGTAYTNNASNMKCGAISANKNTKTFETPVTGNKTFAFAIEAGNQSSNVQVDELKFNHNGTYYTLKELVESGVIKPLVLIGGAGNGDTTYAYNGEISFVNSSFAIIFMTNKDANITGCSFTSNKTLGKGGGWMAGMTDIDNFRITYV